MRTYGFHIALRVFPFASALLPLALFLFFCYWDLAMLFYAILIGLAALAVSYTRIDIGLLLLPIAFSNPIGLGPNIPLGNIANVILVVLTVGWLLQIKSVKEIKFPGEIFGPTLLIIGCTTISLYNGRYLQHAIMEVIHYCAYLLILFSIIYTYSDTLEKVRRLFAACVIAGLLASLVGIGQFIQESLEGGFAGRIYGWLGGSYGSVIGATFMLCIGSLMYEKNRTLRSLTLLTLPFASLALILSQTRAWIGAVGLSLVVMLFWTNRRLFLRIVLISACCAILILALARTTFINETIQSQMSYALEGAFRYGIEGKYASQDASILMRLNAWQVAGRLFLYHPIFGIGIGSLRFEDYITARLAPPEEGAGYVDNQYIQLFTETGIIAGIAWLLLIGRTLKKGASGLRARLKGTLHPQIYGLFLALLVFYIGGFFWVITSHYQAFALMTVLTAALFRSVELNS